MSFFRRLFSRKKPGPNVEVEEVEEEPSIMDRFLQAVEDNDLKKVEELIDSIVDLDATTPDHKRSALCIAADKDSADGFALATILLGKGASPNGGDLKAYSPLMYACRHQDLTLARFLIGEECHADVNYEDEDGVTALVIAARLGDGNMVNALIQGGANVNQKMKKEEPPDDVRFQASFTCESEVERLNCFEPFNGNTVLMGACRERELGVVRQLLTQGADVHPTNEYGNTALHIAAHAKSQVAYYTSKPHWKYPPSCAEIVDLLLEQGAEADVRNIADETPLDRTVSQLKGLAEDGGMPEYYINHYKNLSSLLRAGSPTPKNLDNSNEGRSLYSMLLRAYHHMQPIDDDREVLKAFVEAVKTAVSSGIQLDSETLEELRSDLKDSDIKQELIEFLVVTI